MKINFSDIGPLWQKNTWKAEKLSTELWKIGNRKKNKLIYIYLIPFPIFANNANLETDG